MLNKLNNATCSNVSSGANKAIISNTASREKANTYLTKELFSTEIIEFNGRNIEFSGLTLKLNTADQKRHIENINKTQSKTRREFFLYPFLFSFFIQIFSSIFNILVSKLSLFSCSILSLDNSFIICVSLIFSAESFLLEITISSNLHRYNKTNDTEQHGSSSP